jgi:hypothetical protein
MTVKAFRSDRPRVLPELFALNSRRFYHDLSTGKESITLHVPHRSVVVAFIRLVQGQRAVIHAVYQLCLDWDVAVPILGTVRAHLGHSKLGVAVNPAVRQMPSRCPIQSEGRLSAAPPTSGAIRLGNTRRRDTCVTDGGQISIGLSTSMKLLGSENRGGFAFRELVVIEKPAPANGLRGASREMGGRYLD